MVRQTIALMLCLAFVPIVPAQKSGASTEVELDVAKILWQPHSNTEKYFGKPIEINPPGTTELGWDYGYANGNGTVGTKTTVLLVVYRYKQRPKSWQEALRKVGLPANIPPVDVGTSFIWPARGVKRQPITFRGRVLNRVILQKDFSDILVDGHKPGTY